MKSIKLKTWIIWALILFSVGLVADYFFWHLLFHERLNEKINAPIENPASTSTNKKGQDDSFIGESSNPTTSTENKEVNNFLASLQKCAPEIAAQAIATPESLIEYLQKSIGVTKEEISLENYHLVLPDGSVRRVHIVTSDNTNSTTQKEIRFFKLDQEGYPERLPLSDKDTLESLLAMGKVTRHEIRSQLTLKDGTTANLEKHDNTVFEFQFNNHGKILSCRFKNCQCP